MTLINGTQFIAAHCINVVDARYSCLSHADLALNNTRHIHEEGNSVDDKCTNLRAQNQVGPLPSLGPSGSELQMLVWVCLLSRILKKFKYWRAPVAFTKDQFIPTSP